MATQDGEDLMRMTHSAQQIDYFLDSKGAANGLCPLGADSMVPQQYLPSYVDDIVDLVALSASAPASATDGDTYYNTSTTMLHDYDGTAWGDEYAPEDGKIYLDTSTSPSMSYRWSGSAMVAVGAAGTAATTAYDNTASGLAATTVQAAVDELKTKKQDTLIQIPENADLNAYVNDGEYAALTNSVAATTLHAPWSTSYHLSVRRCGAQYWTQTATRLGATKVRYVQYASGAFVSSSDWQSITPTGTAPDSASGAGTLGEIRFDSAYLYVCVATNTWKRIALSTW